MAKKRTKKTQTVSSEYTDEERRRYLFRTAAEMRLINDAADKRSKNRACPEDDEPEPIQD